MLENISVFGLGFLGSLFGFQSSTQTASFAPTPVQWSCKPVQWVQAPKVTSGLLKAKVMADCEFKGNTGGGFKELNEYLVKKVRDEATKVHSGPTPETYANMPSTGYDVTVELASGSNELVVRQDAHIATDTEKALVFDTISKSASGKGNAQYLQKVDAFARIEPLDLAKNTYKASAGGYFEIKKPWFAPTDIFINEVKKNIEKEAADTERKLIEEVAQHI